MEGVKNLKKFMDGPKYVYLSQLFSKKQNQYSSWEEKKEVVCYYLPKRVEFNIGSHLISGWVGFDLLD